MDCIALIRRCCVIFCIVQWKRCTAESPDEICFVDPSSISGGGMFDTYNFDAEEGILLEPRKLLGTVILSGNDSSVYTFDEPYFKSPRNMKVSARPRHFDVVFEDISPIDDSTTVPPSTTTKAVATMTPVAGNSTAITNRLTSTSEKFYDDPTGSADDRIPESFTTYPDSSLFAQTMTYTSSVASGQNHTAYTTEESSTSGSSTGCVRAYIYQIYDLDREKQDTHYLTINDFVPSEMEYKMSIPILVIIHVSDINDNTPIIDRNSLSTTIKNDTGVGLIVGHIKAEDADIGRNADLRYKMIYSTERRGNENESFFLPSVLIEPKTGVVVLIRSVEDLTPPSKLTFSVVVKDNGDRRVCNRATATATVSIVDMISSPTMDPPSQITTSSGVIGIAVGCSIAGVVLVGIIVVVVYRVRRSRVRIRNDGALEFMLDDETLVTA